MNKLEVMNTLRDKKLVAVVRVERPEDINPTVDALLKGGVSIIELTMTIPDVLTHVPALVKRLGNEMVLGMGSVLNGTEAQKAADAGASFIVSPIMKKEIIETAIRNEAAVSVGAFSPTEIQTAWEYGADVVKVFPAEKLGPSYLKGVRAPMPHLKLLPTGGVSVDNVHEWLNNGAFALGVGSALVDTKAIRAGNFDLITQKAKAFVDEVETFKKSK
ncbi:MAG: bifunctional 4-hydroxy-2-oxoglutarate aldolase/2-dehydro-3-deoxy-phosphogluconate aldolase [Balneolales bacterium]